MAAATNPNLSHEAKLGVRAPKDGDIPVSYLRECVVYNDLTGVLLWLERPLAHFPTVHAQHAWNAKMAGKSAESIASNRYGRIALTVGGRKRRLRTHRVIFALLHGRWPVAGVDHIDHKPTSNKIANLREATQSQNNQNARLASNNKSGFKGVSWCKPMRKWLARLAVEGRQIHLGYFDDIVDAVIARMQAEREYHPFAVQHRRFDLTTIVSDEEAFPVDQHPV